MGELLPVRRERGFAVPQRYEVGKAEKKTGESRPVTRGTGLTVSATLRQMAGRAGQAEDLAGRRTVQTGESVLAEVQERLGRIAELAREAAGEGGVDREALQAELDQLREEIDRMTGGAGLFLDEDAEGIQEFPVWLARALAQDGMNPERLLAGLGLDRSASGADLLAALVGRSLESDPVAGRLAALYLGAVIAQNAQSGELNPEDAWDGLELLMNKLAAGVPLDEAIKELTGGEYASLADFQEQFMGGTVPGLQDFLVELLLTQSGEVLLPEVSLLSFLAGSGGMEMDLLMALMSLGQASAGQLEAGAEMDAALAMEGAVAPHEASQPVSVMQFGELQVMGRDLSAVTYDTATGQLTIGGTADVLVQGRGQGEQAIQITSTGTVTVQDVRTSVLTVDAAEARILTTGRNELGEVLLGEGTALTLDGRGLLRAAAVRGGEGAVLRLAGGAVVVTGRNGETAGMLTVPVVLDGPASLVAHAAQVRDSAGKLLEPFDVVWKTLLPGFSTVTSMTADGRHARMSLLGGEHADAARLWLAKGDLSAHGYPARTLMIQGRDEAGHSRTRYAYLRWSQRAGAFQEVTLYPNPFTVTGGEQDRDWMYEEETHTLHILTSQVTGISGGAGTDAHQEPFSGRIALMDDIGALNLTLGGVICRVTSGQAFCLGRENDVTLVLRSGTNNLFESGAGYAGISLGEGTSLRIDCAGPGTGGEPAGVLTAAGGTGCAGIGQDDGRRSSGHIMIRGGMVTGGEKPGQAGTVTIVGSAGGASAGPDPGSARTWARMGLFLQMGEDTVILPQFPLSSRTLQLNKLRVSTREYANAARMTIDADRRWVSRIQTSYATLSGHLEQSAEGPVRDTASAGILLREVARSAPILSDRAMQARSLQSLKDVNRLLR